MPHKALEKKLCFLTFAHARFSIRNEALEIISELKTSFSLVGRDKIDFSKFFVLSMHVISFVVDVELE